MNASGNQSATELARSNLADDPVTSQREPDRSHNTSLLFFEKRAYFGSKCFSLAAWQLLGLVSIVSKSPPKRP